MKTETRDEGAPVAGAPRVRREAAVVEHDGTSWVLTAGGRAFEVHPAVALLVLKADGTRGMAALEAELAETYGEEAGDLLWECLDALARLGVLEARLAPPGAARRVLLRAKEPARAELAAMPATAREGRGPTGTETGIPFFAERQAKRRAGEIEPGLFAEDRGKSGGSSEQRSKEMANKAEPAVFAEGLIKSSGEQRTKEMATKVGSGMFAERHDKASGEQRAKEMATKVRAGRS